MLSLLRREWRKISRTWALDDYERARCWYLDATPRSVRLQMKVKINCSPQDAICSIHGPWSYIYAGSVVCVGTCTRRNDHGEHLNYVSWPISLSFFSMLSVASLFSSRNVISETDKKFNFLRLVISHFKSLLFSVWFEIFYNSLYNYTDDCL